MKLVEVVILVGSQCLSPLQHAPGVTEAGKVACAVLIRQDPATADVEILPQAAATDPAVVAMLVKPQAYEAAGQGATIVPASADAEAEPVSGPIDDGGKSDAERVLAVEEVPPDAGAGTASPPRPKPAQARKAQKARQVAVRQRPDSCGSYKAVWYTTKAGHKRYRCVKTG